MTVSTRWSIACLALCLEGWCATSIAGSEDNAVNVGQDFTRPLGRVDLRWTYRDLSEDKESHIITLRAEQPWKLSDRWKLNTRLDIPAVYNTSSSDNQGKWGLGDMDVQAALIRTLDSRFAAGGGIRAVFPSASEDRFGSGKYQLLVGGGVRAMIPEISPGSFFAPQLQYNFDVGGDHSNPAISQLRIQPTFHVALTNEQFITFLDSADIRYSFRKKKWFVPFDATYGKKWGRRFVTSIQVSYPIITDLNIYEVKTLLRFGYFF